MSSLKVANLKINLKSHIKPKAFSSAFEVTKSWHQRNDRTGSILLCQTDHKIKFMLFLSVKQDSCVRAVKKIGGKLCERRGPWEKRRRKEFPNCFSVEFYLYGNTWEHESLPHPSFGVKYHNSVPLGKHFSLHCHVVTGSFHLMPGNQIIVIFKRIHT